ncbi:flagellar motor protein MotB [Cupriavidus plantarum]|uniref:flagellar motor protein MotB n=1 Tax=Cupriavidus plantarum TaxID=942865 RepID=UPI000E256A8C|nr:flagellar motor protein MotB [Cupriavidus plantarum]REE87246.1 MotA/MotB-like proton-channel complex protein [Cupriavidus plantarum]
MFGPRSSKRRNGRDEGEKPFWISFSDLMTALMVLFLVSMAVALIAITQKQKVIDDTIELRKKTIAQCLTEVEDVTKRPEFKGVTVHGNSIDFGTVVLFADQRHSFEKPADERFIRSFVPEVLKVARAKSCETWLKRVVVEGFASRTGNYLYNLNLSYLRSQRVLCALLNTQAPDALSEADRKQIQTLFLVGGSSFNTASNDGPARMRRVEVKLEFRDFGSLVEPTPDIPLDPGKSCPNDLR